ncbi:MAG: energy transducer TonB [Muribaculaceae bacterium]|nr:energy transducer TonB [Muribaculaceae bacterium]
MKKLMMIFAALGLSAAAYAADTKASFPDGTEAQDEFIANTLVYPQQAKDNGIEGVVTLIITVKADGTIGNIKVKRMVDPDLEAEAMRVVKKMPAWTPATQDGVAVESTAEIPFSFSLTAEE